jgi:hypothetical protein
MYMKDLSERSHDLCVYFEQSDLAKMRKIWQKRWMMGLWLLYPAQSIRLSNGSEMVIGGTCVRPRNSFLALPGTFSTKFYKAKEIIFDKALESSKQAGQIAARSFHMKSLTSSPHSRPGKETSRIPLHRHQTPQLGIRRIYTRDHPANHCTCLKA